MLVNLETAAPHHFDGHPAAAELACHEVLAREPHNVDAFNNLGRALESRGRAADARTMYRHAISIEPNHAAAHLNLGLVSLLLGDYATGWREYEWRWRVPGFATHLQTSNVPRWDGSDPAGRTILVDCEPGLAECIQFARYVPLLSGRGAQVVLRCPPPLMRLFGGLPNVCLVGESDSAPRTDYEIPLASLPLMFETTPATIPTFAAYLRPAAPLVAAWRDRLRPLRDGGRRLVGLAWSGERGPASDFRSGLDLERLAPLFGIAGVRFVSLDPLANVSNGDVADVSGHLHDVADVAACVSQLDLLIATDNPAGHVAGALGKPVHMLVDFAPAWRWAATGGDSAWYPSMRLSRQPAPGDWVAAVHDVMLDLKRATLPADPRRAAA